MSRKLKIMIVLQLFVTAIYIIGMFFDVAVLFTDWSDFTKWNVGIYAAGNVGEHVSDGLSKK